MAYDDAFDLRLHLGERATGFEDVRIVEDAYVALDEPEELAPLQGDALVLEELPDAEILPLLDLLGEGLRVCWLDRCHLPQESLQTLITHPRLAQVEALLLDGCPLTHDHALVLARALPTTCRVLDLSDTRIGDPGALALAQRTHLEHLALVSARLTGAGLLALLETPIARRPGTLHVEPEDSFDSLMAGLIEALQAKHKNAAGDAITAAVQAVVSDPALYRETRERLAYQWELIVSN